MITWIVIGFNQNVWIECHCLVVDNVKCARTGSLRHSLEGGESFSLCQQRVNSTGVILA